MNFTDDMNSSKKTRKRTRNPSKHKANEKKQKVQRGEQYTTNAGKLIEKKTFQPQAICRCKKNCAQKINSDRQQEIFSAYYKFENWNQKTLFLRTIIKTASVKENLNPIINLKKRDFSHKYYLGDQSGVQYQVCLSFLLNCVQITRSRLLNAKSQQLPTKMQRTIVAIVLLRKPTTMTFHLLKSLSAIFQHMNRTTKFLALT